MYGCSDRSEAFVGDGGRELETIMGLFNRTAGARCETRSDSCKNEAAGRCLSTWD
jgi:hypothetical protein